MKRLDQTIKEIEQLMTNPPNGITTPANSMTVTLGIDTTALDDAQKKADKLKATLSEVQELIRKTNIDSKIADAKKEIIAEIIKAVETSTTYRTKSLQT